MCVRQQQYEQTTQQGGDKEQGSRSSCNKPPALIALKQLGCYATHTTHGICLYLCVWDTHKHTLLSHPTPTTSYTL